MTASLMAGAQIQNNHDVAEQNRSSEPPLRFLRSTPGGNSSVRRALTVALGGGRSPLAFGVSPLCQDALTLDPSPIGWARVDRVS